MYDSSKLKLILALSMMCFFLVSQISIVTAANNQGLAWGIEPNDRFDYAVEVIYHSDTLDLNIGDEMYVIVNSLPAIPDDVNHFVQLAVYNFTTYWSNGTTMDSLWYDVVHLIPFYVLPIGNWSLIEELTLEATPTVQVTQDASYFSRTGAPTEHYNGTDVLMKSDGVIAYGKVDWNRTGTGDTLSVELIRDGYVLPTTSSTATASGDATLLYLGLAVAVPVVIVVAIMIRRR